MKIYRQVIHLKVGWNKESTDSVRAAELVIICINGTIVINILKATIKRCYILRIGLLLIFKYILQ